MRREGPRRPCAPRLSLGADRAAVLGDMGTRGDAGVDQFGVQDRGIESGVIRAQALRVFGKVGRNRKVDPVISISARKVIDLHGASPERLNTGRSGAVTKDLPAR